MPSRNFHYYLCAKLNADVTSGTRQLHCYVVKCRFTSLYDNRQLDLDLHLSGSRVPGYILPSFEKTLSQFFKINTYQLKSNHQIYNYTHFTELYIAGNFPHLTDVIRISGRERVPTRPSSPSSPFCLNGNDYTESHLSSKLFGYT